jgi:hypothetical protein
MVVLNARHAPLTTADEGPAIAGLLRRDVRCSLQDAYLCLSENFTGQIKFFQIAARTPDGADESSTPPER